MNPKCNMDPERFGEILGRFSGSLTAAEEDEIKTLFPQYLFFRNEYEDNGFTVSSTPIRVCTCTACGDSFEAVRGNYARGKLHNEKCNCPHCKTVVEGKAVYKYRYDMPSLESWVKTAVVRRDGDGILIEAGNARRRFCHDDLTGDIDWYPTKRYSLRPGEIQMWEHRVMTWACSPFEMPELKWLPTKTVSEPFPPNMMGYNIYEGDYRLIALNEALSCPAFRYCQIEDFYLYEYGAELNEETARWMVKYLAWYAMRPQIEMAVKFNLGGAVHELISTGKQNAKMLNWKGKRPEQFLRMQKTDAKLFIRSGMDWNDLRYWRTYGEGMTLERYVALSEDCGGRDRLTEVLACASVAGAAPEKAVRYVRSLMPQCRHGGYGVKEITKIWKDYLDMARQLGYDLQVETVAMPKDLKDRHDNAAAIIRTQASAAEMKRYKKRRRELETRYAFQLGELCILVPTGTEEIIQEGRTLHHCVGGYAARHIEGLVTILFLRQRKKPGRSFLTIEMETVKGKERIRQIHGYKNENYKGGSRGLPEKKYGWFLEPWLDWVNAGSPRNRKGEPVLPEKYEKTEVKTA